MLAFDRGYLQGIHIEERDLLASFRRAEDDRAVALVGRRTGEEDDLREVSTDEVPAARHFVIGSRQSAMTSLASAIDWL